MYEKLFKVLRKNYGKNVTPPMVRSMGLKKIKGAPKSETVSYYCEEFNSCYFSITINYNTESVLDIVEKIIENDASSYSEECATAEAGFDW